MTAVLPRPSKPRPPKPSATPEFRPIAGLPRAGTVRFVEVPDRRYLAVDGTAQAGGDAFQGAVAALYTTAYGLHFGLKDRGIKAPVGHLEGLWERRDGGSIWQDEGPVAFDTAGWRWTLVIALPGEATEADVAAALEGARKKRPSPELDLLRVMTLAEGRCVEAMHVGPYATEPETIARMREAAEAAGLREHGPHHEIYLGDPRASAPERLRTVLRQPVR